MSFAVAQRWPSTTLETAAFASPLARFIKALGRNDKSVVIQSVTDLLLGCGGRFLRQARDKSGSKPGIFFRELSKKESRIKVGHALRDMALFTSRSEASTLRVSPATIDGVVEASTETAAIIHESDNLMELAPFSLDPIADLEPTQESIFGEAIIERSVQFMVQFMAESNSVSSSECLEDSSISCLTETCGLGEDDATIPRAITTTALPTESLLSTVEGRDILDASILSWLVDESNNLLDF
jgi:hypothetical protein